MRPFWIEQALFNDGDLAPALQDATQADVCIVGGGFTGLWTAIQAKQQNPALDIVFRELFDVGGPDVEIRPASDYVELDVEMTWADVVAAAGRFGDVAFGHRLRPSGGPSTAGVGASGSTTATPPSRTTWSRSSATTIPPAPPRSRSATTYCASSSWRAIPCSPSRPAWR